MNTHTYKIACPSCGASSGFTETAPNSYTCGYCGTAFEHLSFVPEKAQEKALYDFFKQVLSDSSNIPEEDPDKSIKVYSAIVQMSGAVASLHQSKFIDKVILQYEDFITLELQRLAALGVAGDLTLPGIIEKDIIAETKFYAEISILYAQSLYSHNPTQERLLRALSHIKKADQWNRHLFLNYDHNCTGLYLDILEKIEEKETFQKVLQEALKVDDTLYVKRLRYRFKEYVN